VLKYLAEATVCVVFAAVAGGYVYWQVIGGLFTRTEVNLQQAAGGVLNILLVGSDSRDDLNEPEDLERFGSVGGQRADTIILAQVVASEQRGVLISFPRDLWVPIHAGERQFQAKINAAYADGPQAIIDTVARLTQLPINHYMEINMAGFREMVDAIGGIEICNEQPFFDRKLNFSLPAGVSQLDGNQALSFVRARQATPGGDFDRIGRQQQFIRAVMSKVGRPAVLSNPVRVNDLARAFASNITVDQFFQLDDMVRFALSLRRVEPDQLRTYTVPGNLGRAGGQSVVLMNQTQAEPLFAALRERRDPADVASIPQSLPSRPPALAPGLMAQAAVC
jgi:LCP family protein required for cell wall assembly